MSPPLDRLPLAVTSVSPGLFSSFSETWPPPAGIRTADSRRGQRRAGTRSRCGGSRTRRAAGSAATSTDRPPCTCRWSQPGAGTTPRLSTSSPSSTGTAHRGRQRGSDGAESSSGTVWRKTERDAQLIRLNKETRAKSSKGRRGIKTKQN